MTQRPSLGTRTWRFMIGFQQHSRTPPPTLGRLVLDVATACHEILVSPSPASARHPADLFLTLALSPSAGILSSRSIFLLAFYGIASRWTGSLGRHRFGIFRCSLVAKGTMIQTMRAQDIPSLFTWRSVQITGTAPFDLVGEHDTILYLVLCKTGQGFARRILGTGSVVDRGYGWT